MPKRVLFDLNVVLDVIEARVPHNQFSGPCLAMAEAGEITGMIAACSIDTLAYLLERDMSPTKARAIVSSLLVFLEVAPVDGHAISAAIEAKWNDLEDAILYQVAVASNCDCVVTRNVQDFFTTKNDRVLVMTPQALLGA